MTISRSKKLMKNTVIISIGKICTSMITFLLLPLYTSILSTEEYGIVDLLNTLMSLLLPVIGLQVEKGVFRELLEARKNQTSKQEIITTGFLSLILQCLISIPIFIFVSPFIKNDYQYFLLINVLAYVLVSFLQQVARGLDAMTEYAISSFINAAGTIIFNVLFLIIFRLNVYGMLLGTFLGFCVTLAYLIYSLHFSSYIHLSKFKKPILKTLFQYSLPLIPNALAWWVFSASDRVIVSSILGLDANGILAASLKFSAAITTLYNIFDTSWIESVSTAINDKDIDTYFNRITNVIIKLFTSLGLVIIAFMPFIFSLLINEKFESAYYLIPITIISAILNIVQGLVAVVYAAKRNTKSIARTSLTAAIINIIVHLLLIKPIGIYAAVISTLAAFLTLSAYRIFDVSKKYFKVVLAKKFIILSFVIFTFVIATYYIGNTYANILSVIITIMFVVLINKGSFTYIRDIVVKKLLKKGANHYES